MPLSALSQVIHVAIVWALRVGRRLEDSPFFFDIRYLSHCDIFPLGRLLYKSVLVRCAVLADMTYQPAWARQRCT